MLRKWRATLALGLILLLAGIPLACRPTPTLEPTHTPAPTARPAFTFTPVPTFTPEPTYTPGPTFTPGPTWTPKPTWTPESAERPPTGGGPSGEDTQVCEESSRLGRIRQQWKPRGLEAPPYEGLIYVDNQVVITGYPDDIDNVIAALGMDQYLEKLGSLDLDLNGQKTRIAIQLFDITTEPLKEEPKSVELVTCLINQSRPRLSLQVFADPNYHLSPAGWAGGGSPWTQNGGGWVEGIVGGGQGSVSGPEFEGQWAFGEAGISLDSSDIGSEVVDPEGRVRIGVFDTSPFTDTFPFKDAAWTSISGGPLSYDHVSLPWGRLMTEVSAQLSQNSLTVWHFDMFPAPTCPGFDRKTGKALEGTHADPQPQDLSNHGLFVASLAHAVSPSSHVYLVRVLEDDACGNLYSIIQGIKMFMVDAVRAKRAKEIDHIVLNLSLGVHQPPCPTCLGLPEEVHALRFAIEQASKEAIVVAAAGNDSYNKTPDAPNDMEIPAIYPNVIGVAASNRDRSRGCFSNADLAKGSIDMAAPGGDGVPGEIHTTDGKISGNPCMVPNCSKDRNQDQCLIGLVHKPSPGYAYWVGTSFAAPLVSGLEALLLEANMGSATISDKICKSLDATLPNGIINLRPLQGDSCPPRVP